MAETQSAEWEDKRGPGRAPNILRKAEDAQRVEDELDLQSWFAELGADQEVQVKLVRRQPKFYKGVSLEGSVDTFHEFIDEAYIKERFGGGTYTLFVTRRDDKGRLTKNQSRTIKIAGLPKLDESQLDQVAPTAGNGVMNSDAAGLAGQAMNTLKWQLESALSRGERVAQTGGVDPVMLQTIVEPLREQVRSLADSVSSKDRQLMELLSRPKNGGEPTVQDRVFEKMIDGESARIESLRTQHESELRQLKSIHQAELDRERDRAQRDLDRLEKQHQRELDTTKDAQKFATEAMKTTYETRIDSLKGEIARLQAEMLESKTQIGELKAKKEKTLPEQAQEIVAMQDALKSIGIGGKDDEDEDKGKSVIERMMGRLIENPEAIGQLVGGVRGATGPSPEQVAAEQQAMAIAQHQQARQIVAKRKAKRARAAAAAGGVSVAEQQQAANPLASLSAAEVGMAVQFMDTAIQNGTDPTVFAASARSAIPADILRAIEAVGIDEFLKGITLPQDSHLRTQRGRAWMRSVAEVLLQGAAE